MRRTKIIATLGPASTSETVVRELIADGVDVFRFNFSHGTHDGHAAVVDRVRRAAQDAGRIVALLQDLSGPKIRIGKLRGGGPVTLKDGESLSIVVGEIEGDAQRVSTTYADLPKGVHPGDTLLLDDGKLELRVKKVVGDAIETVVVEGGPLGEHKGINVPSVELPRSRSGRFTSRQPSWAQLRVRPRTRGLSRSRWTPNGSTASHAISPDEARRATTPPGPR